MDAGDHQSFVLRLNEESIAWVKLDGDDIKKIQNVPSVSSFDGLEHCYSSAGQWSIGHLHSIIL